MRHFFKHHGFGLGIAAMILGAMLAGVGPFLGFGRFSVWIGIGLILTGFASVAFLPDPEQLARHKRESSQ